MDGVNFGELSNDEDFKSRIVAFEDCFKEVQDILEKFYSINDYDDLNLQDKIRYDLFQAFAINSLYWFYLRIKGIDPNKHDIRSELNRIREFMGRSKKIYEKQTLMPKLDQEAAKRFIKSGLWTPKNDRNKEPGTFSRKRKRVSDDEDEET